MKQRRKRLRALNAGDCFSIRDNQLFMVLASYVVHLPSRSVVNLQTGYVWECDPDELVYPHRNVKISVMRD